jgi:hypothetical protein
MIRTMVLYHTYRIYIISPPNQKKQHKIQEFPPCLKQSNLVPVAQSSSYVLYAGTLPIS